MKKTKLEDSNMNSEGNSCKYNLIITGTIPQIIDINNGINIYDDTTKYIIRFNLLKKTINFYIISNSLL